MKNAKEVVVQSKEEKKSRGLARHTLFALFLVHLGMAIFHTGEERCENVAEIIAQL